MVDTQVDIHFQAVIDEVIQREITKHGHFPFSYNLTCPKQTCQNLRRTQGGNYSKIISFINISMQKNLNTLVSGSISVNVTFID